MILLNIKELFNPSIISLDIGSYETKMIEGKVNSKGVEIKKASSFETPDGCYENGHILDKELLSYVLKEELNKNSFKSSNAYITINSSDILTREIILPKVDEEELDGILSYQGNEYFPTDISNCILQYKVIGTVLEDEIEKINLIAIAVPEKIAEDHFQLLQMAELKPIVMDFQSNSVCKLFRYNSLINGSYETYGKTLALIDLGHENVSITIVRDGIILVTRIVGNAGKDIDFGIMNFFNLSQDEAMERKIKISNINDEIEDYSEYNRMLNIARTTIDNCLDDIDKVFKYYLTRDVANQIDYICLYGGMSNINGIEQYFETYFEISTIKINRLDKIFYDGIEKYINCIGALLREKEEKKK